MKEREALEVPRASAKSLVTLTIRRFWVVLVSTALRISLNLPTPLVKFLCAHRMGQGFRLACINVRYFIHIFQFILPT